MDDILQHTVKQWNILILMQWKKVSQNEHTKDLKKEINKKLVTNQEKLKNAIKAIIKKSKYTLKNL